MRYLTRLKPLGPFFFGGEITFGEAENKNYLVRSNLFPQQTTILGMLRKKLLIQEGYLKVTDKGEILDIGGKQKIESLIGPKSFDIRETEQGFGVIKRISPVFLCKVDPSSKEMQLFNIAPKDLGMKFKKSSGRSMLNKGSKDFVPFMEGYKSKKVLVDLFIKAGTDERIKVDEIFLPAEKIGITKGKGEVQEEKAFYKQTAYRLINGFEFVCIVEIDSKPNMKGGFVFMGADKSAFIMTVEDYEKSFEDTFSIGPDNGRIVLLSDAYVEENIYEYCYFAMTGTVTFRNIKSSTGNYRLTKEKKKHTFLKRGSVLYPNDRSKVITKMQKPHLQKIGYNIFN